MSDGIQHPLAIGTRVYYEDYDGGDGTIVQNDNTTAEFAAAVATFNQECRDDCPVNEVDYIIDFDDLVGLTPVQADGILRILP
jgi:capsule polysaccharide modification protein KpsS